MWTVKITTIEADPTATVARVTYLYSHTDGRTETITERVIEPDSLKKIAADHIRELNRRDAVAALIANPPLGAIDLSAPVPTQEELDAQAYSAKRFALIQLKQDVEIGLATQADLDDAAATVLIAKPVSLTISK